MSYHVNMPTEKGAKIPAPYKAAYHNIFGKVIVTQFYRGVK